MKRIIAIAILSIASLAFADTDFSKYMHLVTPIEGVVLSQESIDFLNYADTTKRRNLKTFGHGGGTNGYGCHYERKTYGYHCH